MRVCPGWLLLAVAACDDGGTEPDGGDDGDADTDTDSDTDADADADTDTDPPDTDTDLDTDTDSDTDPGGLGCFADWTYDVGDDGTIEGSGIDLYDDADHGLLVFEMRDYPATTALGLVDYTNTYTYDANGRLIVFEQDVGNDGVTDYVAELVYDPGGLLVELLEDLDGSGATDLWWTYTYDAYGRRILAEGDVGDNGTIDVVETRTYTDPVLAIGTATIDLGNDGTTDALVEFEHDALGRLLYERTDSDANGESEYVYTARYDAVTGLLTGEELKIDVYDPDIYRLVDLYTYDSLGRRIDQLSQLYVLQPVPYDAPPERATWTFGGDCP